MMLRCAACGHGIILPADGHSGASAAADNASGTLSWLRLDG
jgi:hypothetical protein